MRATRLSTGLADVVTAECSAAAKGDKDEQARANPRIIWGNSVDRRPSRRNSAVATQRGAQCTAAASQAGPGA